MEIKKTGYKLDEIGYSIKKEMLAEKIAVLEDEYEKLSQEQFIPEIELRNNKNELKLAKLTLYDYRIKNPLRPPGDVNEKYYEDIIRDVEGRYERCQKEFENIKAKTENKYKSLMHAQNVASELKGIHEGTIKTPKENQEIQEEREEEREQQKLGNKIKAAIKSLFTKK